MSRLPPELVLKVLGLLGWEDERSVRALLLFGATSSDMRDLAQVDSVWEAHLQRWTRARGDRGVLPARELYRTRALLDREAGDAVSHLVTGAHLRIPAIERIKQLGDDVIDFLVQANPTLESDPLDHIARSFWTARAIESISRDQAVDVWQRIAADEYDDERQAFEDGVNAFALYRGARPGEMQQLFDKKLVLDNDVLEGWNGRNPDLEEIAKAVHLKMVDLGLKPCEGRNFHRLDNHFLNLVIKNSRRAGTLPMSLCALFCAFIRRLPTSLGVQASPIGFPGRMLVLLERVDEETEETGLYFDVFDGAVRTRAQLRSMAVETTGQALDEEVLEHASAKSMCLRVARNILTSVQHEHDHTAGASQSLYACAMSLFLINAVPLRMVPFVPQAELEQFHTQLGVYSSWVSSVIQSSEPTDVSTLELVRDALPRGSQRHTDLVEMAAAIRREDSTLPSKKAVLNQRDWRVGSIFMHRQHSYIGVICGWDSSCEAGEEWIAANRVNALRHGRFQAFFNVCTEGVSRYVALENLTKPVGELSVDVLAKIEQQRDFGRHFLRREGDRYIPSAELELLYGD